MHDDDASEAQARDIVETWRQRCRLTTVTLGEEPYAVREQCYTNLADHIAVALRARENEPVRTDDATLARYQRLIAAREVIHELGAEHARLIARENAMADLVTHATDRGLALEADRDALAGRLKEETAIVDRVWRALGISTYEQAGGKAIDEHVKALAERVRGLESALQEIALHEGDAAREAAQMRSCARVALAPEPTACSVSGHHFAWLGQTCACGAVTT